MYGHQLIVFPSIGSFDLDTTEMNLTIAIVVIDK